LGQEPILRIKAAPPDPTTEPLTRAAARFGLRPGALPAPVRAALAALQLELDGAAREIEALKEKVLEAEALADHDPLIPVLNRRAFLAALQRTAAFVERYGGEAAVLYLDLDEFKAINDGFGHAAGDAALKYMGRLLLDNVRETDTVGRLGGDEFGVILVQVGKDEARRKANALGEAIAGAVWMYEGVAHRLSASIGLHAITCAEGAEDALARADEAMYAAKRIARRARAAS
jgi:diguanylate cyclase (GGDEF)-like protein